MEKALRRFMSAPLRLIKYKMVQEHPALVGSRCVELMENHRRRSWDEKNYRKVQEITKEIIFVQGCLRHGVERMFFGWSGDEKRHVNLNISEEIVDKLYRVNEFQDKSGLAKRIELYEDLLPSIRREEFPELWGDLHNRIGAHLSELYEFEEKKNYKTALDHFNLSQEVYTYEAFPVNWANIQNNKAVAFFNQSGMEDEDDIELSIKLFKSVFSVFKREVFPTDWAETHVGLATIHMNRLRGKRPENLEQAIHHCGRALEIFTREAFPIAWAETENLLANSYEDLVNEERADNIEEAIKHYKRVLTVIDGEIFPMFWGKIQDELANAYEQRIKGDPAENLEKSIQYHKLALEVRKKEISPRDWTASNINLGNAYRRRICGDKAENIECSIFHFKQALEVLNIETSPVYWAITYMNMANAYWERIHGDKTENIEKAVEYHKKALAVFTRESSPLYWAAVHLNLSNAYLDRTCGDCAENIEIAIQHSHLSLKEFTRDNYPPYWAESMHILGEAYVKRESGDKKENLKKAIGYFLSALEIRTVESFTQNRLETLAELLQAYIKLSKYDEAIEISEDIRLTAQLLRRREVTRESMEIRIEEISELYSLVSWCLLKRERIPEALLWHERGKTKMIRERTARDKALFLELSEKDKLRYEKIVNKLRTLESEQPADDLPGEHKLKKLKQIRRVKDELEALIGRIREYRPDFLSEGMNFHEMRQCLSWEKNKVIITFIFTEYGSGAVILAGKPGAPIIRHVVLDEFTDDKLKEFIDRWTAENNKFRDRSDHEPARMEWGCFVDLFMEELYKSLFTPLEGILKKINPQSIVFIPHKSLHILPLHLLNKVENGERQYLIDEYEISFSPSFEMLRSEGEARLKIGDTLVAAADPTEDLPWSREEVNKSSEYFNSKKVFIGADAGINNIIQHAAGSGVIHIACHGEFDMTDPYRSMLVMAPPKKNIPDHVEKREHQSATVIKTKNDQKLCEYLSLGEGEKEMLQYNSRGGIRSRVRTFADGRELVIDPDNDRPIGEPWTLGRILRELRLTDTFLVVLSACESGVVNIERLPDEYMGIPAGFLAAGARSVVSSLWKVNDKSSCELMKIFYENMINKKQSPTKALCNAQKVLRSQKSYSNVYYWGAFQVSGQG